jgi:hypothetical protein
MITRQLIENSTDTEWLYINEPDKLANQLYPTDPKWAEHAALKIFGDLEGVYYGWENIPAQLDVDQIEDWFAARAVMQVIVSKRILELLRD